MFKKNPLCIIGCSVILLTSFPVFAREVAKEFNCPPSTSPEKIISAFIQNQAVEPKPYDSADGILSFAAKSGLTALGFPLVAITGWEENSKMFGRGPGTAPPVHFAMIVQANAWQVRNAAKKQSIALAMTGRMSYPRIEVQSFNAEHADTLPLSAKQEFAYASIACNPRP